MLKLLIITLDGKVFRIALGGGMIMGSLNLLLLLKLLVAHFLSDFVFQPAGLANGKNENGVRSWHLYVHTVITEITLFVILGSTGL